MLISASKIFPFLGKCRKCTARQVTFGNITQSMRCACWITNAIIQKHTHVYYTWLFCCKIGYANAPQCYVMITKPLLLHSIIVNKGVPRQPEVDEWVPGSLRPRIILTFRHYMGGSSSAIRTGHLYPRRNPWYSFSGAESTPGHIVLSEGTTKKIPSGTTGNRSRDRPTSI